VSVSSQKFAQNTLEQVINNNYNHISNKLVELKSNDNKKKSKLQSHNELCAKSRLKPKQTLTSSIVLLQSHSKTSNCTNALSIDCSKSPKNLKRQTTRIQTKSEKKSYKCNQCRNRYSTPNSLQLHISRYHSGRKEYSCNQCDKKFNRSDNLTDHMRIHSGVKPYACDQCDKKFNHSSHLTAHMRIHSGVKPYACNQCDKKFTVSSSLTVHMRTHSGDKPYACNICDKKFCHSGSLTYHTRIHSENI
jgi:uncharacterized Zn-finger protein